MNMLKDIAYYKTGGSYQELFQPQTLAEVRKLLPVFLSQKTPFFILGKGTNSLVLDEYWPYRVLALSELKGIKLIDGETIEVLAGVENSHLAQFAIDHELLGLGWMNGLPGQVGGTVRMNARCYGSEISQVVSSVESYTPKGELVIRTSADVFFGYKNTSFMTDGHVITRVIFSLKRGTQEELKQEKQKMTDCLEDRRSKHQFDHPSCGCVFKNPYVSGVRQSSGKLLEEAGVQGMTLGSACVSPYHCNFVFNQNGQAKSEDILNLTLAMRQKVWEHHHVWLEYEMEILGDSRKWQRELSYKPRA